jgi:predicted amidohydrolase
MMKGFPLLVLSTLLVVVLFTTRPAWAANATHYRAAVVAHWVDGMAPGQNNTNVGIVLANLRRYEGFCNESGTYGAKADIISFPETGTGYLLVPHARIRSMCEPVPLPGWAMRDAKCDDKTLWNATTNAFGSYGLHAWWASCAARRHGLHIVVNMCQHNATTGKFYNTNIAFGPTGELLAVYHKVNIADSGPYIDQPRKTDPVTFDTAFGVRFGMFTCFDLWFQQPTRDDIREQHAYDFMYPEGMSSPIPMFRIPDVQNAWSLVNNATLVSSSLFGTSGSGAFVRGTPVVINNPVPTGPYTTQRVVFGDIPILHRVGPGHPAPIKRSYSDDVHLSSMRAGMLKSPSGSTARAGSQRQKFLPEATQCGVGPLNCVEFYPFNGTSKEGNDGETKPVVFDLVANHDGPYTSAHCSATVWVPPGQVHKHGSTRWVLAAFSYTTPPSVATPNGQHVGGCLVMQCYNLSTACEVASLTDGFATNLEVSSVWVAARFGGAFNSTNTIPYPFVALLRGTSDNYTAVPLPANRLDYQSMQEYTTYGVSTRDRAILEGEYFFSAGVYATAYDGTYQA